MNPNCIYCIWYDGECAKTKTPIEDIETCLIRDNLTARYLDEKVDEVLDSLF